MKKKVVSVLATAIIASCVAVIPAFADSWLAYDSDSWSYGGGTLSGTSEIWESTSGSIYAKGTTSGTSAYTSVRVTSYASIQGSNLPTYTNTGTTYATVNVPMGAKDTSLVYAVNSSHRAEVNGSTIGIGSTDTYW